MVIVLLAVIALSLSGSDLTIKKFADNAQKYISLTEEMDCIEVAADGYTMPFTWTFILTDDYAEFRFRWPNGRIYGISFLPCKVHNHRHQRE